MHYGGDPSTLIDHEAGLCETCRMVRGGRPAHDRRALRGRLTTRLVTPESMSRALKTLLADTERYVIAVSRPRFSWRSGKAQEPAIIIYDGDPLALDDQLDPRLRASRQVIILITQDDGGVAEINLTSRTWGAWNSTPALTKRMLSVNQCLLDGARTRLIGALPAILMFSAPIWLDAVAFFTWAFSSPAARNQVFGKTSNVITPHWLSVYISALFHLWPIFVLLAAAILLIDIMSGGLSVWPDAVTETSAFKAFHSIRGNLFGAKSVSGILGGIIVGLVVAYIVSWFTH